MHDCDSVAECESANNDAFQHDKSKVWYMDMKAITS